MGRDGSGYRYGFLARAFRHSMLFIYASEISDLTGYFFRGSKVSCRAGPYLIAFESLGIAMATYCGQNYGAGKPERILQGIKVSSLMMLTYAAATWMILMLGSRWLALLFVAPSEVEILDYTEQFLHISCWFFPAVGLLCILRYAIQGVGFSNLAMLSGVSEMIARILVSLYAVPAFGFLGVCFGDPLAWVAADLFLIPAFLYVYKKIKKRLDDEKVSVSAV